MSEGKYFGLANGQANAYPGGNLVGAQQASVAPPPSIASAVGRLESACERAREIKERLGKLADRLTLPIVGSSGNGSAPTPIPSSLIQLAHSRHDDLSNLMADIYDLTARIDRAIG